VKKLVAVFVGTRPEAIKMAPVIRALEQSRVLEPWVISTGQHREMLDQVLELFDIAPRQSLAIMARNQTLSGMTARLIEACDVALEAARPALALVQGDTTTVLAATLACFYRGIPVGHVEAGLRTGDLAAPFPEEANRVLVGRLARLHFAPTAEAAGALLKEGVSPERLWVTGNTVIDALHMELMRQRRPAVRAAIDRELEAALGIGFRERPFVLVTGHRRENFGDGFRNICQSLSEIARRRPEVSIVYPVHLNPNVQGPVHELLGALPNVKLLAPQPYDRFVALMGACRLVLTDSGGVQEEAPGLGKPVLVMRKTTERPEGVAAGTVRLVATDVTTIVSGVLDLLDNPNTYRQMAEAKNPYGDGHAAPRIVRAAEEFLGFAQAEAPSFLDAG